MTETTPIELLLVRTEAERRRFVEVQFSLNRSDPAWVPPLRTEVLELTSPRRNPWFDHARAAFFIATRTENGVQRDVGRISAQVDELWLALAPDRGGGPGCGTWGMFEAADAAVAAALLGRARDWLAAEGMARMAGPLSLSIWDEPGLLVRGFEQPPTVMMGHNSPAYPAWVEAAGHRKAHDLHTGELDITRSFSPLVQRIVAAGERNGRIRIRKADTKRFAAETAVILSIVNDAWDGNWGIVPFTAAEIAHAGRKLKPVVFADLVRIAEYDGEPVAFMLTLPDVNEMLVDLDGRLFPFGFARLLWRLRGGLRGRPQVRRMRVPLMGVRKAFQASRLASQMAFMMIEAIRRDAVARFGASRAEIGWIAEDNGGMLSVAEAIGSTVNRTYRIYARELDHGAGTGSSSVDASQGGNT